MSPLVVGRGGGGGGGGDGAGRFANVFLSAVGVAPRRAEAQMDGALTTKKGLHKEVEVGGERVESLAMSFFSLCLSLSCPHRRFNIDNRGLANCVRAFASDRGGLRLHTHLSPCPTLAPLKIE